MPNRIHAVSKRGTNAAPEQCSCGGIGVWTDVSPTKRVCTCERCQEVVATRRSKASTPATVPLTESDHTRHFCKDAERRGCFVQALAGSMLQVGVPDRYFVALSGTHTWLEMKVATRKPPERINWLTLFGSHGRAPQDEFVRGVCGRDADGARVCVTHADPAKWALYRPVERPEYELVMVGRESILNWVCR